MSLWREQQDARLRSAEPLASRMRPTNLDEFVGQSHLLGPGMLLRRMLEADRIGSVIFYGPPGTGKTTLAELIAQHTQRRFEHANAAAIGVKDVRFVLDEARRRLAEEGTRTVFFLDEVHRFNKAQQDVLLGDVERGVIALIGATTENPYFAINSALVSRSQVFRFESVPEDQIQVALERAITDPTRGFGQLELKVDPQALAHWSAACDGDVRKALNALEIAVESRANETISLADAEQSIQETAAVYDRAGDQHHDAISAFIKSVRGSDPDAAVYWLARMLHAGEDPMFIARRIAILASEDIGNADPRAVQVAAACYDIVHRIGLPECRITLAQATTYLACAPKSNAAYAAVNAAMQDIKTQRTQPVPKHLRAGGFAKEKLGHVGYAYAHGSETGFVDQTYLGVDVTYYQPTDRGHEKTIREYLAWVDAQRAQPRHQAGGDADQETSGENPTPKQTQPVEPT